MKFFKKYKSQLLILILGIVVGFFIDHIRALTELKWEKEINPLDFANLLLTVIIAVIIAYFVEPSKESSRIEKELHTTQLTAVKEAAKEISAHLVATYSAAPLLEADKQLMVNLFRSLSNQLDVFFHQASHCKLATAESRRQSILNLMFTYKRILTGGNFYNPMFSYNARSINMYENPYLAFIKSLTELMIDINRG